MDKFSNAFQTESKDQPQKSSSSGNSKRWLWAAAMCSLVGVASASYVLINDHIRISNLQEQIAQRRESSEQVMQRVLALSQVSSSSTTTTSATIDIELNVTKDQGDRFKDMHVIDEFSQALHDQLKRLDAKVTAVELNASATGVDLTAITKQVKVLKEDDIALEFDVQTLLQTEGQAKYDVWALQTDVNDLEAKFTQIGGAAGSFVDRLRDLESKAVIIKGEISTLESTQVMIQNDVAIVSNDATSLTIEVNQLQQQVDDLISAIDDKKPAIKRFRERLIKLEQQDQYAQADILLIQQTAQSLHIEVDALSDQVDSLAGLFGANAGKAQDLMDRVIALEDSSTILQGEMTTLQSDNVSIQVQIDNLDSAHNKADIRMTRLEESTDDLTVKVNDIDEQVTKMNNKIRDVLGKFPSLQQRILAIESDADALTVRVNTQDSEMTSLDVQVTKLSQRTTVVEGRIINEMVLIGPSETLEQCDTGCTECKKGYYSDWPNHAITQCVDETVYAYGNQCDWSVSLQGEQKCSTGANEYCQMSWVASDPLRANSPDAECRSVPQPFIDDVVNYGNNCDDSQGLCVYGCSGQNWCAHSWPREDPLMMNSQLEICRCTNYY